MRRIAGTAIAAAVAFGATAPAASAFGISDFEAEVRKSNVPGDLESRAGSVPFEGVTDFSFARSLLLLPDGNVKDVRVDLPPGLLSNPQATPKCTEAQFPNCPADTQLGTESLSTAAGITLPASAVYNMVPEPGQVSLFSLNTLLGRSDIVGGVRPSDYGLYFTISDVPPLANLTRSVLTFFGTPATRNGGGAAPKWFIRLPTACDGPQTTRLSVVSWSGATATATSTTPGGATDCDALPFSPKLRAATHASRPGTPAGLTVKLTQADGEANVQSVSVTLPHQFGARLDTLAKACPEATFKADPAKCAAASQVGTARAATPLLPDPLRGPVYLVSHSAGKLPTLEVVLKGPALTVGLSGTIAIGNGITSTFGGIPDLPISEFALDLPAGPGSALTTTGSLCAGPVTAAYSGVAHSGKKFAAQAPVDVAGCGVEIVATKVKGKTALVTLRTPAAGAVSLSGKGLKPAEVTAKAAETLTSKVRLSRTGVAALRKAKARGRKLKIRLEAAFDPASGESAGASAASARLTFKG